MRKSILALTLGSTAMLGACATNPQVAQDAAIGGVGGAAVGAVVPGVSVIEGAAVGAAIGGLAGAIWSDTNNDGYVDGYTYNGQYYAGTPSGYDPGTHSVLAGAATEVDRLILETGIVRQLQAGISCGSSACTFRLFAHRAKDREMRSPRRCL